jgi:hypothetical protein
MTPSLWQRIAVRASQSLWRVKGSVLLGAIVLCAAGAYAFLYLPTQPSASAPGVSGGGHDCADTVMSALAGSTGQQQAYQCMDTSFQQRVSPQQFAAQLESSGTNRGPITKLSRVASYEAPAGATLVYYAVDTSNDQSLGFIVYLGPNGKVLTIE